MVCSGRDGGREETKEDDGEGVVNAAEASVKGVRRAGMWTVFLGGAVLGRVSAWGRVTRAANDGAICAMGASGKAGCGGAGIGSAFVRWMNGKDAGTLHVP